MMNRLLMALGALLVAAPLIAVLIGRPAEPDLAPIHPPPELFRPAETAEAPVYGEPGEDELFREAARTAWRYVESEYHPGTGLVSSVVGYPFATVWDIASTLAAYHSARELGVMDEADFDRRMGRALETLRALPLFDATAFNKNYQVARGYAAGPNDRAPAPTPEGYGWSAVDMGRLLIWLRIVERSHPRHAAAVREVVARLDLDGMLRDGQLVGSMLRRGAPRRYQEGRLGYEQYAAAGFALWDRYPQRALHMSPHAERIEVLDVPLYTDRRGGVFLTGEPFFLMGLELGWWEPLWEEAALQVLAAQKARFDRTGQLTMVSEDAIPVAPDYFYYYTLHTGGEDFAVTSLTSGGPLAAGPRWLSAKAAFAWYALLPGPYTWSVLQAVEPASRPGPGWGSGIYERTGRPTGAQNINTAAVILEAALYHARRRPLLAAGEGKAPPSGELADSIG